MEEVLRQLRDCGQFEQVDLRGHQIVADATPLFFKFGTGGVEASQEILEYEFAGLQHLHDGSALLRVPRPVLTGTLPDSESGFLVMEHIEFARRPPPSFLEKLGAGLGQLHSVTDADGLYGFPADGCCGSAPQLNNSDRRQMGWVEFWREYRLEAQLAAIKAQHPTDAELQELGAQLSKRLPEFFGGSGLIEADIAPALLHGDLWSGNYRADTSGTPCIFDPACYYGHHEADHGINHMFGGGEAFQNNGYQSKFSLAPGYDRRAQLYELHHHLNHLQMFGSGYREGAVSLMRRLLR